MATNNNHNGWLSGLGIGFGAPLSAVPEQQSSSSIENNQYEPIDKNSTSSNTLKRNPKMELSKNDLIKLVTYFEGEIQARDIAIAALKSEKLKQVVNVGRYRPAVLSDPYTALLRDSIADGPSAKPPYSERDMTDAADHQLQALEQLSLQQKWAHQHMINILKEDEAKHRKDIEDEKFKHDHDMAQGEDITYGLEMGRTRLRQELEIERNTRKKLEKEVKRQVEMAAEERSRQKQIVLLLLAERKKIIVKYIEERKRSEDLAQILSEEKARIDSMAEGLEEESKKSLRMEAEMESQQHVHDAEKKTIKTQLANKNMRIQELEAELQKLKVENDALRTRTSLPLDGTPSMMSSVAKVVQPTATVSSVPVSGPTTGIAQSVVSGQVLRQTAVAPQPLAKMNLVSGVSQSQGSIRTPGKSAFHQTQAQFQQSQAPATPPKKGSGVGRGVPPPIPPNKPVIPSKTIPARRPDGAEIEKKKAAPVIPIEKPVADTSRQPGQGIEILGQELADFQQMFVTMATSNNT